MNEQNPLKIAIVRLPEYLSLLLVAVIWVAVLVSIVGRLFGIPTAWASELARLGLVWSVFFGVAAGVNRGAHTSIDFLVKKVPPLFQWVISLAVKAAIGVIGVILIWKGRYLVLHTAGDTSTLIMGLDKNVFYYPALVGGVLIILNLIFTIWEELSLPGKEES